MLTGCIRNSPQVRYDQAQTEFHRGHLDSARLSADRAYRELQSTNAAWSWKFRFLEAEVLLWTARFREVVELLEDSPPRELGADFTVRRNFLRARALCRIGESPKAEKLFGGAEKLLPSPDSTLAAELAFARGKCAVVHDRSIALTYYDLASRLAHGGDSFVEARALLDKGSILFRDERYDEAGQQFNQILSLTDADLLREPALGYLAESHSQLGDFKQAIPFSEKAAALAEKMQNLKDEELSLIELGKDHYSLWELQDAEARFLKALAIAQTTGDKASAAACLNALARVALRRSAVDLGKKYVAQGKELGVERERLHFMLDEAEIAASREQWPAAEELFRKVSSESGFDTVDHSVALRELGEVFWKEGKLNLADREFRESIATAEAAMVAITKIERRMSFLDEERFYDSYIRFLVAQNRVAEALSLAERARGQVWTQESTLRTSSQASAWISTIQKRLEPKDQVVLAYWITNEESFLWLITPKKLRLFHLPGHLELHKLIDQFNAEIQNHREIGDSMAAQALYKAVVEAAAKFLPVGSHAVVIPSKVLSWVSFGALVVPGLQPHYWIEDVDVQVAGSVARMLDRPSSHPDIGKNQMLVLGAPVEGSKDFPVLKYAEKEMHLVQAHFPADQETVISGSNATPAAYLKVNPGTFRLIHLDTHATASDLSPLDSAVILSPGPDRAYKLYARDITTIPLRADLVTISACYGAGTRWYNNEGVVGLGWAFLRAGAHQVIAGLWEVDDASSPQLMDDFYGELTQGKSAAEALRDAKLKMLHSSDFHRHPYYWASLQLYTGS